MLRFFAVFSVLINIIILSSCDEALEENKSIVAEVKKRKVGKITQLEIYEETDRIGGKVILYADSIWRKNLVDASTTKDVHSRNLQCNIENMPYKNSSLQDVSISKIGLANSKKPYILLKELGIWEAYQYNFDHQIGLDKNIQKIGDTVMLYTTPILFDQNNCFTCHTNNKMKDLAGMWSVRLNKKKVVENIWLQK